MSVCNVFWYHGMLKFQADPSTCTVFAGSSSILGIPHNKTGKIRIPIPVMHFWRPEHFPGNTGGAGTPFLTRSWRWMHRLQGGDRCWRPRLPLQPKRPLKSWKFLECSGALWPGSPRRWGNPGSGSYPWGDYQILWKHDTGLRCSLLGCGNHSVFYSIGKWETTWIGVFPDLHKAIFSFPYHISSVRALKTRNFSAIWKIQKTEPSGAKHCTPSPRL